MGAAVPKTARPFWPRQRVNVAQQDFDWSGRDWHSSAGEAVLPAAYFGELL
jgi:hypothetical protein